MRKRNNCILWMIMSLLVFATLVGCGSKDTTGTVESEAEAVMTKEAAMAESTVEVAEEAVAEPTVAETVEETTEERPVYEGIDMESTLPGEEWIKTFDGVITEPKVVILNDETGRKQIVEDGDKVTINPDTDYIGVYLPGDAQRANHSKAVRTVSSVSGEFYELLYLDAEKTRERGRQAAAIYVTFNGEEVELPFDLIPE